MPHTGSLVFLVWELVCIGLSDLSQIPSDSGEAAGGRGLAPDQAWAGSFGGKGSGASGLGDIGADTATA